MSVVLKISTLKNITEDPKEHLFVQDMSLYLFVNFKTQK